MKTLTQNQELAVSTKNTKFGVVSYSVTNGFNKLTRKQCLRVNYITEMGTTGKYFIN